jgi:hypothetical protein
MLVPDEVRKCVVFVCYKGKDGFKLAGTAFFVSIPREGLEGVFVYLVQARHVVEKIKEKSIDGKIYLRINQKDKPSMLVSSELTEWKYHPASDNVDVAVIPWAPNIEQFDYRSIPSSMAITQEIIDKENIGCGDEVFVTGLFSNHYGQKRNLPIIRIGNIACMPEEPVQTKDFGLIEAYLIEARSIGGLSGSPVFVHLSGVRKGSLKLGSEPIYWLGLMHGHYDLSKLEFDELEQDTLIDLKINMGIAIVVPASQVLEVLNQRELVEVRKKRDEVDKLQRATTSDAA